MIPPASSLVRRRWWHTATVAVIVWAGSTRSASCSAALVSSATMSHMEVGVRELRNDTARVIEALRAGERVVLTVRGEPVADLLPHGSRTRWLSGRALGEQLRDRSADPGLRDDLTELAGETLAGA